MFFKNKLLHINGSDSDPITAGFQCEHGRDSKWRLQSEWLFSSVCFLKQQLHFDLLRHLKVLFIRAGNLWEEISEMSFFTNISVFLLETEEFILKQISLVILMNRCFPVFNHMFSGCCKFTFMNPKQRLPTCRRNVSFHSMLKPLEVSVWSFTGEALSLQEALIIIVTGNSRTQTVSIVSLAVPLAIT